MFCGTLDVLKALTRARGGRGVIKLACKELKSRAGNGEGGLSVALDEFFTWWGVRERAQIKVPTGARETVAVHVDWSCGCQPALLPSYPLLFCSGDTDRSRGRGKTLISASLRSPPLISCWMAWHSKLIV